MPEKFSGHYVSMKGLKRTIHRVTGSSSGFWCIAIILVICLAFVIIRSILRFTDRTLQHPLLNMSDQTAGMLKQDYQSMKNTLGNLRDGMPNLSGPSPIPKNVDLSQSQSRQEIPSTPVDLDRSMENPEVFKSSFSSEPLIEHFEDTSTSPKKPTQKPRTEKDYLRMNPQEKMRHLMEKHQKKMDKKYEEQREKDTIQYQEGKRAYRDYVNNKKRNKQTKKKIKKLHAKEKKQQKAQGQMRDKKLGKYMRQFKKIEAFTKQLSSGNFNLDENKPFF